MGEHHQHGHDHSHGHNHSSHANRKSLFFAFLLITAFMIVEFIGGIWTNSLALLSDAGHMLSDSASLFLSVLAMWLADKPATATKTYGYKRTEILAALFNGVALSVISIYIFVEAYHRFSAPPSVASKSMMLIAILGLLVNIMAAWILMRGDTSENLNVRSAFLHVLGDMLGSVGAIIAAILIWAFGWNLADPIASVIVAILVLFSGWRVIRDSVNVLMEGVPIGINLDNLREGILSLEGVEDIHDLHVWTVTSGFPSLSCHIVINNLENAGDVLRAANRMFKKDFHIIHTTIQVEDEQMCAEGDVCDEKIHQH